MPSPEAFNALHRERLMELAEAVVKLTEAHGSDTVRLATLWSNFEICLERIEDRIELTPATKILMIQLHHQFICVLKELSNGLELDRAKVLEVQTIVKGYSRTVADELAAALPKDQPPTTKEQKDG